MVSKQDFSSISIFKIAGPISLFVLLGCEDEMMNEFEIRSNIRGGKNDSQKSQHRISEQERLHIGADMVSYWTCSGLTDQVGKDKNNKNL